MKVRKQLRLILIFQICLFLRLVGAEQWGFVNPQTDCKINCLNSGVCVFDRENEQHHKCICMIGEYEGDLCEIKVTSTTTLDPLAATDGQIYDEQDEFHEASQDLHYTEFTNDRGADEIRKLDSPTVSEHPTDANQADDYAEFEPHHNDELYHEAVIEPSESTQEPISVEPRTEATAHVVTSRPSYHQVEQQQSDWDKQEEENDDFYEEDTSWMMFKRRARNGAQTQHACLQTVLSIAFLLLFQFAF
ncbi:EGF-like domain-containing protein [Aphelenchoides bicaudatus]|nr:EGF-like domain-containing protein [Aphelenchoides bicaudatus]